MGGAAPWNAVIPISHKWRGTLARDSSHFSWVARHLVMRMLPFVTGSAAPWNVHHHLGYWPESKIKGSQFFFTKENFGTTLSWHSEAWPCNLSVRVSVRSSGGCAYRPYFLMPFTKGFRRNDIRSRQSTVYLVSAEKTRRAYDA